MINPNDLDRHITGNWGEDSVPEELKPTRYLVRWVQWYPSTATWKPQQVHFSTYEEALTLKDTLESQNQALVTIEEYWAE